MFLNTNKFNTEIESLKNIPEPVYLHPLRQEQIKQTILESIAAETNFASVRLTWYDPTSLTLRWAGRKRKFMQTLISILTSLGLLGGTAFASVGSNPGDVLYPVKRAAEKVHVAVTVSEQHKAELEAKHAEKRLDELNEVKIQAQTDSSKEDEKTKAEVESRAAVSHALDTLTIVRAKLEAKQNTQAAASLSANIARLQAKAEVELGITTNNGNHNGQDKQETTLPSGQNNLVPNPEVRGETDVKVKNKAEDKPGSSSVDVGATIHGLIQTK